MVADWKKVGQSIVYKWIDPFIKLCIKLGITPNFVTLVGLFLNICVAIVLICGAEFRTRNDHSIVGWAGALILFAGLMDMIDGRLARVGKMSSKYGALYDSVLDRYSEMFMFLGICYYLVAHHYFLSSIFAFIAMIGSIMVSYTRSRAEGLGITMSDVGFMQRPERILLIGISGIVCGVMSEVLGNEFRFTIDGFPYPIIENISFFTFPLVILAILANVTAIKRLLYAKKQLES
jgi:CDP-diacylglycerol--glycerol-3-phosphate 3-phosphatidyltransferase